jgi:hypothetical protein
MSIATPLVFVIVRFAIFNGYANAAMISVMQKLFCIGLPKPLARN